MTDRGQIEVEFAKKCFGSLRAGTLGEMVAAVFPLVADFLGARFWMQVNRGTHTDGKWRVLIGVQNVATRGASRETVTATNEDLAHAMMEACVLAADNLKVGAV